MIAVLLVPAAGDPFGLLAPGKCGAMPPLAAWYTGLGRWEILCVPVEKRALVLAWDSAVVVEGVDRIVRALNAARVAVGFRPVFLLLNDYGSLDEALSVARDAGRELGCEVVIL